jgi:hypothetical protein
MVINCFPPANDDFYRNRFYGLWGRFKDLSANFYRFLIPTGGTRVTPPVQRLRRANESEFFRKPGCVAKVLHKVMATKSLNYSNQAEIESSHLPLNNGR